MSITEIIGSPKNNDFIPFKENIELLANRKKGERFWADKTGKLHKLEGWASGIWYWLSNLWNGGEAAKVNSAVTKTLIVLDLALQQVENNRQAYSLVQPLFDPQNGSIGRMSPLIFDRRLLQEDTALSRYALSKEMIRVKIGPSAFIDVQINARKEKKLIASLEEPQVISIDLGSNVLNDNLHTLVTRRANEKVAAIAHDRLVKSASLSLTKRDKQEVNRVVKLTIGSLVKAFEGCDDRISGIVIEHLLANYGPISQMSRKMHDRSIIHEESSVEKHLMPEFDRAREAFVDTMLTFFLNSQADPWQALFDFEKDLLELGYLESVVFTEKLGLGLKRVGEGGSGGARTSRDREGKKVACIKPGDEGPEGNNNNRLTARFKRIVVSPKECIEGNPEPIAEWESYLVSLLLAVGEERKQHLVPPTEMRHVYSRDFVGKTVKLSSIQAYITGCAPLKDVIGCKMHSLPRFILRAWYGLESNRRKFMEKHREQIPLDKIKEVLGTESELRDLLIRECLPKEIRLEEFLENVDDFKEVLTAMELRRLIEAEDLTPEELALKNHMSEKAELPQALMELLAAHNFAIEDIDCHFENVLVKTFTNIEDKTGILARLLRKEPVSREEAKDFAVHLFTNGGYQDLLQILLFSKEAVVQGEKKRMMFVKHDGGSSGPHNHPKSWDLLALRYKHLFSELPHCEEPFSAETIALIQQSEARVDEYMKGMALRALKNILTPNAFIHFWWQDTDKLAVTYSLENDKDQKRLFLNALKDRFYKQCIQKRMTRFEAKIAASVYAHALKRHFSERHSVWKDAKATLRDAMGPEDFEKFWGTREAPIIYNRRLFKEWVIEQNAIERNNLHEKLATRLRDVCKTEEWDEIREANERLRFVDILSDRGLTQKYEELTFEISSFLAVTTQRIDLLGQLMREHPEPIKHEHEKLIKKWFVREITSQQLAETLKIGEQELQNILEFELQEPITSAAPLVDNRTLLYNWVILKDTDEALGQMLTLKDALILASAEPGWVPRQWEKYFLRHLKRIRGNIETRYESMRVLQAQVSEKPNAPIRDLLAIRSHSDFQNALPKASSDE